MLSRDAGNGAAGNGARIGERLVVVTDQELEILNGADRKGQDGVLDTQFFRGPLCERRLIKLLMTHGHSKRMECFTDVAGRFKRHY